MERKETSVVEGLKECKVEYLLKPRAAMNGPIGSGEVVSGPDLQGAPQSSD